MERDFDSKGLKVSLGQTKVLSVAALHWVACVRTKLMHVQIAA